MVTIGFSTERDRVEAAMCLHNHFGSVKIANRWERLLVDEDMMRRLDAEHIPYRVIDNAQLQREEEEKRELLSGRRLYDLRERLYPSRRGDQFRSLQVFECWVCGAITNHVIMGGWPGYGVRTLCPQRRECWHHELEDKIVYLLKGEIVTLREEFAGHIQNDVAGAPDVSLKCAVFNVRSRRLDGSCSHGW